nr:pentatricopeptide repeat-containing protein [Tanacetum cinerariifolium]
MTPFGFPFMIFDVHYDGTFNFMPLRSGDEVNSKGKTVTKDAVDKGKRLAGKGKGIMVDEGKAGRKSDRSRNSGIVIGDNVNPSFSEDDDSDSDIDIKQRFKGTLDLEEMYKGNTDSESEYSEKSIDYLSEGEDELISLRKRNSEAKKNPNQSHINSSTPVGLDVLDLIGCMILVRVIL